jgi:hypothetical protein
LSDLHVQEAKAKYAEMRRLDAEALQITRQLGCQQCMPEPATAAEAAASSAGLDHLDPAERAVFEELHVPLPWPAQQQQQQQGKVVSMGQDKMVSNEFAESLASSTCKSWLFGGSSRVAAGF